MNSITEFKREFTRTMRGYSPEEVDAAIELLVTYGAELESANAEFAEVNNSLIADNDALAAENDRLNARLTQMGSDLNTVKGELDGYRQKVGEAKAIIGEARRAAETIRADAEAEAERIRTVRLGGIEEKIAAGEKRYAALCRQVNTLTGAVRTLYREQMAAIDALSIPTEPDSDDTIVAPEHRESGSPSTQTPVANEREEPDAAAFQTFSAAQTQQPLAVSLPRQTPPRVRRAAMAAAAIEPEQVELPVKPVVRRSAAPSAAPQPEPAGEAPVKQTAARVDAAHADGISVDAVYRPAAPTTMKITREQTSGSVSQTHSFAAVRRTLAEINARLKE